MSNSVSQLGIKKVVFVAPSAYPLGGVQNWLDYLLPGLESRGYEASLALASGEHHNVEKYTQSHKIDRLEILENQSGTAQGRIQAIEQLLLKLSPDLVVVVNIVDVYQAVNNIRRNHKIKLRVVTSLHGIDQTFFAGIRDNNKIIDAVVSTNRLTQELINASSGLEDSRSIYAPYGVEVNDANLSKLKAKSNGLTLAYAGRFDEQQKRFADALLIFSKALKEIDELSIIVAGDGPSLPSFQAWLDNHPEYSQRIKYLGVIKPEEVNSEVYQKSDLFLLTSEWETGPIVAWEAMSQGVCFVSSRYHGHIEERSLVHGKNCLLFNIGDIDGAVEQIKIASELTKRNQINEHALSLIKEKYTHTKSIDAWVHCFNEVLHLPVRLYSRESVRSHDVGRATSIMFSMFGATGLKLLEKFRTTLSIRNKHVSAGSEWPHSYPNQFSDSISKKLTIGSKQAK